MPLIETPGRRLFRSVALAVVLLGTGAMAGCTTVLVRSAVPEDAIDDARPYAIDGPTRTWGDDLDDAQIELLIQTRSDVARVRYAKEIAAGERVKHDLLALSGGGPDGAFGAGLLAGWTARGDRPTFQVVSGVSTGAIIALFAYLGPQHDETLREIYTTYRTRQLAIPTFFAGLTGGTALFDTTGYRRLIEEYIDDETVEAIADAYRDNRLLLIGTTNIDASRPVIWNVGAIAVSGDPNAKKLIQDVVQASSAIPGAFPPVLIPVTTQDGRQHDEMHVDGGATEQVILFSPELRVTDVDERSGVTVDRSVWVVMNNKLEKPYDPVRPRLTSIAGKAASSLIGGSGTGDVYRIFAITERDNADLNVIAIPRDFDGEPEEMFDPVYMGALYDLGYKAGLDATDWRPFPPDFAPPKN